MNSASYEYRNMSARKGAQFMPMGMPIICWKTFPAKTTKMLSTRNARKHPDDVFFSVLALRIRVFLLQNRVPRDLKLNICISDFHFCECRSSL